MTPEELDATVRARAFAFLDELSLRCGQSLPRDLLLEGFAFEGQRVPLLGPQGIFKPAVLPKSLGVPLSITTAPPVEGKPRPYEDSVDDSGLIRYRYRGTDPQHHENVGLRKAMWRRMPLVYFFGLMEGKYAAAWPSFIVGDNPGSLTFTVAVDDRRMITADPDVVAEDEAKGRRAYITTVTQQRLHQASFRERVLVAYRECCAVCHLGHRELLDAAHILDDKDPQGEPWVSNGLALCKIHHAAFDKNIMGIDPDCIIRIREDILNEVDGPMLEHGLQRLHEKPLVVVPASRHLRPNRDFLARRYEDFCREG
jgi:putative restriction endonuclease